MNNFFDNISKNAKKVVKGISLAKALASTNEVVQIPLSIIDRTVEPFVSLNPVDPAQRARLKESMAANGWMQANPAVVWRRTVNNKKQYILTEGFSRSAVAEELGIDNVWVIIREFASEEEAVKAARYQEFSRRHDDAKALFRHFEELNLDELRQEPGRLNERVAILLGISPKSAQKLIKISREATDETKNALRNGEISTDSAFQTVAGAGSKPKKAKPRTFADGVEFALQAIAAGKTPEAIYQEAGIQH